ncbi:hypothetical protein ZIOFF_067806 [Zingiber officinale]|uniref:RING-type E3 ubiquitin transferase n=1 Tax=Zingiber officinale TaxID=94328 RepID=A0A8J5CXJ2_ZINOF|nr:hypothetical protein ZIOFF_067806 [Zingiber officinale]
MGQSSSQGRRNDRYPQSPSVYSTPPNPPASAPNQSASMVPYASSHPPPPLQPPPPPRFYYSTPYPESSPANPGSSYYHQPNPWMPRPCYPPYYAPDRSGGWWQPNTYSPAMTSQPSEPPPPSVEQAKKVKNDVNVHKDSIRLVPDEQNPDHLLVSFTFDAVVSGSITICYFAKEGPEGDIVPLYADAYTPKKIAFAEGHGLKFIQPSGSGIDLGFFDLDELAHPLPGDALPLVVSAESSQMPSNSPHSQITQAVIEKNSNGTFQVKVVKQKLWADGEQYELQEIFGLASSTEPKVVGGVDESDDGKDCVICLSEQRNTTVLPCRHLARFSDSFYFFQCLCSECAKALSRQSNKCPICRQPVEQFMEIDVNTVKS